MTLLGVHLGSFFLGAAVCLVAVYGLYRLTRNAVHIDVSTAAHDIEADYAGMQAKVEKMISEALAKAKTAL